MIAFACAVLSLGFQQTAGLVRDIPNASWEPLLFGEESDRQSINGRAKLSGLAPLRTGLLPKGVIEVRVWEGFGLTYLEGYRFRFEAGKWRGWKLDAAIPGRKDLKDRGFKSELAAPAMGWVEFWKALEKERIYTLSDFESLPELKAAIVDGVGYVVEYQKAGKYRTYFYDNPHLQPKKWAEVDNVLNIVKLLHRSFPAKPAKG